MIRVSRRFRVSGLPQRLLFRCRRAERDAVALVVNRVAIVVNRLIPRDEVSCYAVVRMALAVVRDAAWREDIEGVFEAVESTLDRVESKRRSAAASASRIKAATGGDGSFDPTNRDHLKQRARQMGHTDVM